MSQAELFWGTKFHQNEEKKLRGYILSQDSHKFFEKISPNFEKKQLKRSFSPHMDSSFSLVAFF